jgi:methyl-accepting chemotaxis protein
MWLNRTASTDYREAWVTEYETVIDKGRDYQERTEDVFAQIEVAMEEYKDQATAVTDHVYLGLDNLEEKTSELITANDKLTEAAYALTEQLSTELEEVNLATEAWARHYEEIMRNIEAL